MCWIFATTSLLYLLVSLRDILYIVHRHYDFLPLRNLLITAPFSVTVATISGMASWSVWNGQPSARVWAISASLMSILIFLRPIIFHLPPVWDHHVGALVIGVIGLVAFLWRNDRRVPGKSPRESADSETRIPGL